MRGGLTRAVSPASRVRVHRTSHRPFAFQAGEQRTKPRSSEMDMGPEEEMKEILKRNALACLLPVVEAPPRSGPKDVPGSHVTVTPRRRPTSKRAEGFRDVRWQQPGTRPRLPCDRLENEQPLFDGENRRGRQRRRQTLPHAFEIPRLAEEQSAAFRIRSDLGPGRLTPFPIEEERKVSPGKAPSPYRHRAAWRRPGGEQSSNVHRGWFASGKQSQRPQCRQSASDLPRYEAAPGHRVVNEMYSMREQEALSIRFW